MDFLKQPLIENAPELARHIPDAPIQVAVSVYDLLCG